jgi:hypothetical protein
MPKSAPRSYRRCAEPGCRKHAVAGSDRCKAHQPSPPPVPTPEPAASSLPDDPSIDDLIKNLARRVGAVDAYAKSHPDDLKAQSVAADITTRIGRLIRDRAKMSGAEADSIAQLLSKAVDLLLDGGEGR